MPSPVTALVGGASALLSSRSQRKAAQSAADAQTQAAQMGIDEQRRQFDAMQQLLSPYVQGGATAFQAQQNLLGLGAPGTQDAAIRALEMSPQFQALARQGEEALLQRASATGGLRGGNLQAALAQFRPAMLQQQIQQQFANLGGLAQYGQASAARTAAGAQAAGTNIGNLLQQQGAAQAGGILGAGAAQAQLFGLPAQYAGFQIGRGQQSPFGSLFGGQGLPSSNEMYALQNEAAMNIAGGAAGM